MCGDGWKIEGLHPFKDTGEGSPDPVDALLLGRGLGFRCRV